MEANHISPLDLLWGEDNPDSDYNFVMINNFMQFLEHFEVEVESGKSFSYDTNEFSKSAKVRYYTQRIAYSSNFTFYITSLYPSHSRDSNLYFHREDQQKTSLPTPHAST